MRKYNAYLLSKIEFIICLYYENMTISVRLFIFLHVFRERNKVVDKLSNLGVDISELTRWSEPPNEIISILQ